MRGDGDVREDGTKKRSWGGSRSVGCRWPSHRDDPAPLARSDPLWRSFAPGLWLVLPLVLFVRGPRGIDLHKVHQSKEHVLCRDHSHLRKAFIQRDCCCSWCYRCSAIGSGGVHISMSKGFDGFEWESRQSSSQCNRVLAGQGQPDCDGWDQRCATENLSPSQTHQSSSAQ
jgi:hypothetical protein